MDLPTAAYLGSSGPSRPVRVNPKKYRKYSAAPPNNSSVQRF